MLVKALSLISPCHNSNAHSLSIHLPWLKRSTNEIHTYNYSQRDYDESGLWAGGASVIPGKNTKQQAVAEPGKTGSARQRNGHRECHLRTHPDGVSAEGASSFP